MVMLATWGHLVYRWRRVTLAVTLLVLAATVVALLQGGSLGKSNTSQMEADRAAALMNDELPKTAGASFTLIFGSQTLSTHSARFRDAMRAALAPLRADRRVLAVRTPYDGAPSTAPDMQSGDGKHALAVIALKDDTKTAETFYPALRAMIHSDTLTVLAVGDLAINHDINQTLNQDLQRAEEVSLPLVLLFLLVVFGTVVAALIPLGVGMLAVVGGFAGVYLLARITPVSPYAFNVVTLIGLGVAIDYSLFIVNRFREELARGAAVDDALAQTLATAGRASSSRNRLTMKSE
jgi:RND superfamily putative drug exporter